MLEVIKLNKRYNGIPAIDAISFKVNAGKIFGLLGPNGAGKTTIIRSILGILNFTSGKIFYSGSPVNTNFLDIVGYLPEERGLYRKSKVIDIIKYFAKLKNMESSKIIVSMKDLFSKLQLEGTAGKFIEELSKGNQQKVQFLTAIIHNPHVLILDEPFAGLDPINQQLIKKIIFDFIDSGKIVIVSTHQMEVAEQLCSDIFLINNGKEVLSGSLFSIINNFGSMTYKIKYNGDASILKSLRGISKILFYDDIADVTFDDQVDPTEMLNIISSKISVTHFAHIEPTLHNIFIETIMASNSNIR